ncbi:TIGR04282 family arsenosugar biosynthesis glycosyltransferase [Halopseudomonas sp.]|jgi:rSAM/selenodomain-associated transferase 1|uniref:TIGR04282 family arsenosugar biosynthesis glycosyltransferase n=1 Tax=Halopseudomonas sp. TaxID=2901191 RepID=UPI0039E5670D
MVWLSVVVPVRNESRGIAQALAPLQALRGELEVIVVDGGSTDDTADQAMPLADQLIASRPGRARQMNAGAAQAKGEVLLFLHADTRLPTGFESLLRETLQIGAPSPTIPVIASVRPIFSPVIPAQAGIHSDLPAAPSPDQEQSVLPDPTMDPRLREDDGGGERRGKRINTTPPAPLIIPANAGINVDLESTAQWGRFDVRLSPSSPTLKLVAWMMNQRSRLTGICTGDQAIFVRRDLFERLGGYADIPLMEDIELSSRLRKISRPACLQTPLKTSSRKWQKHGVWRTIGLMWWIRLQYWAGVSPDQLVRQYYGDKSKPAQLPQTTRPLLIFAKAPIPGTVKTRLIPALGADGACCLYQQLLLHTLHQTQDWPGPRYLYCAPDTTHPLFARLASEHHLQLRQQHGDDLGSRMAHALAEHADGALLIGTDCPQISTAVLREADQALQTHDTAIMPSEDGGYVMIGQRQPDPAAFAGMSWSHSQVMADTRRRLEAAGKSLWEGATLWDLDEPEDIPRLAAISLPPL